MHAPLCNPTEHSKRNVRELGDGLQSLEVIKAFL